jgi:hypothetical protein
MENGKKITVILDSSHHGFRHAMICKKEETEEEGMQMWKYKYLNSIFEFLNNFNADELIIAVDSRKNWRKQIFPFYKSNRKLTRKSKDNKELGWFRYENYFEFYKNFLQEIQTNLPFKVMEIPHVEADDIAGVLSHSKELENNIKIIITTDQDYTQLLTQPLLKIYNPIDKKFVETECAKKQLLVKLLIGDKGDDIPSVADRHAYKPEFIQYCLTENIAPNETTLKILLENNEELLLKSEYNFLEKYSIKAARVMSFSEKLAKSLVEQNELQEFLEKDKEVKAKFLRNNKLMNLTAQPKEIKEAILENYNNQKITAKMTNLFTFFVKHSFNEFMENNTKIAQTLKPLYKV